MYIYIQVPPSSENLSKTFSLSEPQFAHLYNGGVERNQTEKACKAFYSEPDTQETLNR